MKIRSLTVRNYKSFSSDTSISLRDGFNFVVGPNNVGKTALLEAFRLNANNNNFHRSTNRSEDFRGNMESSFDIEVELSNNEIRDVIMFPGSTINLPFESTNGSNDFVDQTVSKLISKSRVIFKYSAKCGRVPWDMPVWPAHGLFADNGRRDAATIQFQEEGAWSMAGRSDGNDSLRESVRSLYERKVYIFKAQRFEVSRCPVQDTDVLVPNASNLPAVLAKLNKNRRLFDQFERFLQKIFPNIKSVSVSQTGQELEIFVYNIDTDRSDLAITLEHSGTGLSQVMSILYVAMTIRGGVILIDEPGSFLHPAAAKKLMQILSAFPSNQYILSTHSSELIAAAGAESVIALSMTDGVTCADILDLRQIDHVKSMLDAVGASLSDVFGLEAVSWVEGQTEQECFPLIMKGLRGKSIVGLSFLAMRHTSDFERKRANPAEAWELYERLSLGQSLMPPAISFAFDRDGRSAKSIDDMKRQSRDRAKFLPRETYENYLLDAEAIAAVIGGDVDAAAAQEAIDECMRKFPSLSDERGDSVTDCRGAEVLSEVFWVLSQSTEKFRKMEHSVSLTRWIIENKPDLLSELADYIESLVPDSYKATMQ